MGINSAEDGAVMTGTTCQEFLSADADLWKRAIDHRFLQLCKNATIPSQSFNWWMEQDYGFVVRFVNFLEAVKSKAPEHDQPVLEGGRAALDDELVFFRVRNTYLSIGLCPSDEGFGKAHQHGQNPAAGPF